MGYEERYEAWTARIRANESSVRLLRALNKALTYLGYIAYPLLLGYSALCVPQFLLRLILVPGLMFVAVTLFRAVYDSPRPYEVAKIDPLIHKDTQGKSFPSRHIFSMTMISMCYLYVYVPLGCILLVCTVIMAVIRVLGGVHFTKDVVAGALIAVIAAVIGLWFIPWP